MKLLWLGYLVYSLNNCVMKLCIKTGLTLKEFDFLIGEVSFRCVFLILIL